MWPILLIILLTTFYVLIKWKHGYWSRRGVPSPPTNLIFGNAGPTITFREHIGPLMTRMYNQFPNAPYVGFYKLSTPAILLRDPDLIKDILIKDHFSFHGNDFIVNERDDPLLSKNPFFTRDENWKRGRVLLLPLFTISKTKLICPAMESACTKLRDFLKSNPSNTDYDSKSLSAKFTTENVIKCTFSLDAGCFEPGVNEFRRIGKKLLQPTTVSAIKFLVRPLLPKWIAKLIPFPILSPEVDAFIRTVTEQNRKSRENVQMQNEDLMQVLINIGNKHNATDDELAGHTLGLFLDGVETSSTVLSFAIYELARNPEVQETLYNEIIEISAKHDNPFTFEALEEMVYLDGIFFETMRLHPPMMVLPKFCTKEYTLPRFGNQKEGVTVYPGISVNIPVQAIQSDPNYYPNPTEFQPERFYEEERKQRHKAHYLPFGEGNRVCVGIRFAQVQVKAALMTIVRNFRVKLSPNHKPIQIDPKSILKQALDNLLINFELR